jgi:VanZ family protein
VIIRILAAVTWTTIILIGLSWPASSIPNVNIENFDKVVHFAMFFGFGFLWMIAIPLRVDTRTWVVLITGIIFAIFTELYQGIIPMDRTPSMWDVVADVFGLCMGIMTYHILLMRQLRKRAYK